MSATLRVHTPHDTFPAGNVLPFTPRPATIEGGVALAAAQPEPVAMPTGKLRLTRRGRVVFTILGLIPVIALAVILGVGATGAVATDTAVTAEFTYVSVVAGDSLWDIAVSLAPKEDPRDVIAEIVGLNNLGSSSIQAGQELAIPLRLS